MTSFIWGHYIHDENDAPLTIKYRKHLRFSKEDALGVLNIFYDGENIGAIHEMMKISVLEDVIRRYLDKKGKK